MSFIVVKYGKEQEKLFNTNCKVINLLHCIREACGCKDVEIDLAEEGTGILQFLPSNLHEHTNSILITPKATYVLVRVQKAEDGSMEYIPMLDTSRSNFLVKLRSTRTKNMDSRKRSAVPEKKGKDETIETPLTRAVSANSLSQSSITPGTPNTTIATPSSSTPTAPPATSPAPSTPSSNSKAKTPAKSKKPLFPKIDGAAPPPDSPSTPSLPPSSPAAVVGISEDATSTIVTTTPISASSPARRRSRGKSASLEPINL